ncbi:histidine phosphatase family protein [Dyadobacter sediminis]|uniref:Phosphoglycerate mutase n=1 Tax=Dyadobacter sediminis TaxID=1493691 RepID=A0A5R9KIS9_9BACT|nr:histidine phosphatase family protein [Dyadobacter sediminis]TLU96118.1 phosphoglycerate mutase [Dyadobacter sediminis]GGB79420.1 phosphoglycerate mutase [Dyadobacter sediminis]
MTKILLIRHATNDTVGVRLSGRRAGVHLNEEGRSQAQKLAAQLRGMKIHAIYSSPLERAVETAEPISKILGMETVICQDFLEINFGEWTFKTFKELDELAQFKQFNSFRSFTRVPGGESMPEAQMRMIAGIEKLCSRHPDETVAIVSHADMIKSAVAYYTGTHLDLFHRVEISPASVSIIEIGYGTAAIRLVNYTGELVI